MASPVQVKPHRQVGALPFRTAGDGSLEILLVTSRGSGRWIIPKGWPMRDLTPHESAAREALEEAGVTGRIAPEPIGSFEYVKRLKRGASILCSVDVYPMLVFGTRDRWREVGERDLAWCSPRDAVALVADEGLCDLIRSFAMRMGV
jgi:8-oxo-dGTP pyrophosphatase MutT (NUDIX family)